MTAMTAKAILDEKGRDVFTVGPDITVSEVGKLLTKHKIGAIVVVDSADRICGIVSERDIVRAIAKNGPPILENKVSSVMTSNVKVCDESYSVNKLMEVMTEGRFRHMPVEKDGKIGGIISIGDVVRARIEQVEREAEEIKAYIAS
jgi:CBS domain-containing protein